MEESNIKSIKKEIYDLTIDQQKELMEALINDCRSTAKTNDQPYILVEEKVFDLTSKGKNRILHSLSFRLNNKEILDYQEKQKTNKPNKTSLNGVKSTLLDSISKLDELQQIQVQAYIDGLQGVKSHTTQIDTRKLVSDALDRGMSENKTNQSKETKIS